MRIAGVLALVAAVALGSARLHAQAAKPSSKAPSGVSRGPVVVAPAKPIVAAPVGPRGGSGAMPTGARASSGRSVSVSARQAAEQTIAALVAAMKNLPKRPPAPPESRVPRARRAAAAAHAPSVDAPPPINYHVTWPATPPEPGLNMRVELGWPGRAANGSVALRWNDPALD
jgi:hypothetical protein